MKLSVIIVNYNVRYFLEQALLSVRKAAVKVDMDVWVVDNNSVDDSVAMVREKFPEVKVIANTGNPGFSIANNQAIRESIGEYVLLLNPDTVVEEDTFEKVVAFMDATPDAGGLGVKMIDGSGNFLPESKRGFPSPWVAFCKTFGLSKIFPKSKTFNHYHLGYLDDDETHEVEVLAGAFMMLRRSVLDKVGLLDETFFMYGEDIDLSYRIVKGGFKNYYLPTTQIIHYKGESTKKGSLNYVRVFYQAMIIFAKKHFTGERAWLFILMLQCAIYFRAGLTLASSFFRNAYLPILDAATIAIGMHFIKNFWATTYYDDPSYYSSDFYYFNMPLYIVLWLGSVFFSGGYDEPFNLRRLVRGLVIGTVLLAAVYGFLPLDYRPSRAIIGMSTTYTIVATILLRYIIHFIQFKNFHVGRSRTQNLVIVGSEKESERVRHLLLKAELQKNYIGTVSPKKTEDTRTYLSSLSQLNEVVQIYKIDEVIFCSSEVPAQKIMHWMTALGNGLDYKILPKESDSIIGSSSKNTRGELYTVDFLFEISTPMAQRNKRLFDLLFCLLTLVLSPFVLLFSKKRAAIFKNWLAVFIGKKTWVGYANTQTTARNLPKIRPAVFTPEDELHIQTIDDATRQRLNFLYAKDYEVSRDWEIIWNS